MQHLELMMSSSRVVKWVLVVAIVCLALLFCPAITASQHFHVGGRLGVGFGALAFEDDESSGRAGINVGQRLGGLFSYQLNSVFGVQLELAYARRGWTEGENGAGRKLSYLQLPLLFVLSAPWNTAPQLIVGPAMSYEVGCSVSGIARLGSVSCGNSRVEWSRNKTQVGVQVGLGIRTPFRGGKLEFQLVGDIGVRNTINETLPRGYNRLIVVMMSAVYKIPIGV